MLKFIISLFLISLDLIYATSASSWKPIASPATYAIHQSHPSIGSISHTSNSISSGIPINARRTTNKFGTIEHTFSFLDDDDTMGLTGPDHHGSAIASGSGGDSNEEYHGFQNEGRILSGLDERLYGEEETCSVDKYAFDHEGTIQYHNKLPKMDQFTICFWMRFTNHSGDHTLLTYSVDREPREIQFWVANSKGSSYISMAVHGQQIFRLNYPFKMRKWHHACSSWNGKTGEWQLWVKAERVGRGFHNRLVGHHISALGLLYSGGPSHTGHVAIGLHFEFTLLQIYKVALSAGKAHRDHKHHHVHHFNHDGVATTTTPAPRIRPSPLPMTPNLANGQIPTRVRINLANPPQPNQQPSVQGVPSQLIGSSFPVLQGQQATINTNFINGQFHTNSRLISQQLVGGGFLISRPQQNALFMQQQPIQANTLGTQSQVESSSAIQFPSSAHNIFNQNAAQNLFENNSNAGLKRFVFKRNNIETKKVIAKRDTAKTKRGLVMLNDGSLVDDSLLEHGYEFQGLAKFGQPEFKQGLETKMNLEDEIKEHDREPAGEEVKAVKMICTSCDSEPFKGAVVFAWNDAKTHQEGTIKGRSVGGCGYF